MKILLTGATGYIGKRLLPALLENGHRVVCCVRDKNRFNPPASFRSMVEVVEVDFLDRNSLSRLPQTIDGAYYLMHSMSSAANYQELELQAAVNFRESIAHTSVEHVLYLSGIINEKELSKHLASRKAVELELAKGNYRFTTLRAGIIIGSGSASFEIIRDLVEKLPIMVAPKWLNTRCQPIGIRDVIRFLAKALFEPQTFNKSFDIGGADILTYKEMLLGYAKKRGLKRRIFTVPVMTPKLSSYWLYFVTATSYKLATALVSSMKVEVVCRNDDLNRIMGIQTMDYSSALERTLQVVETDQIVSSWKDSMVSGRLSPNLKQLLAVPTYGCLIDKRSRLVVHPGECINRIWRIGGTTGWYYADGLWRIRGLLDKLLGGVGLRRGRTHQEILNAGDAVDFWRVLLADKARGRLLLFAEMKLPGEAWLEFRMEGGQLHQIATFRPKGLAGRLYWYGLLPVHNLIFKGMIRELTKE